MLLLCYACYSEDAEVLDQLARYSHHYSIQPVRGIRFYIREDSLSLALLVDAYLERCQRYDEIL
jgi:hypothetical protein